MSPMRSLPPIVLFGYNSSPFTRKVRLCLRLLQLPYTFVQVPSMMPRPILTQNFNLTYRKIPVLAIGRDVIIDTSLIVEYLHGHPDLKMWREAQVTSKEYIGQEIHYDNESRNRPLARVFASFFTDRPLFRLTTGLIPSAVWRTRFGEDRAGLIGHQLDADKLERKVPRNLVSLDTYLSLLEPMFADGGEQWVFGGEKPSLTDVSLFYQLEWGYNISKGVGFEDLTGVPAGEGAGEGMGEVFNETRYPGLWDWYHRFERYIDELPAVETQVEKGDLEGADRVLRTLRDTVSTDRVLMLPTPKNRLQGLEERIGLKPGVKVKIAPDDTGRDNPTTGTLVGLSPEEVVIEPDILGSTGGSESKAPIDGIRLHFPRVGFVILPASGRISKL